MTVPGADRTYDITVRRLIATILRLEYLIGETRARILGLQIMAAAAVFSRDLLERLEALIEELKEQLAALEALLEETRAFLAWLRQAHGPCNAAHQSAPENGAEKRFYVGV